MKSVTSDQNADGEPADSEMEQETPDLHAAAMESAPQVGKMFEVLL